MLVDIGASVRGEVLHEFNVISKAKHVLVFQQKQENNCLVLL